jgi:hypothetical protein
VNIEFKRTGERRYAVIVHRDGETLAMNPAPGYDALMPHDLSHLIVELELALDGGIFGQLAAGGHAATFHPTHAVTAGRRATARDRRRRDKRGSKLAKAGRDDGALSERATYICLHAWLERSNDPELRARARTMAGEAAHVRDVQSSDEAHALSPAVIDRACERFDALSREWRALAVGESMFVEWRHDAGHRRRAQR